MNISFKCEELKISWKSEEQKGFEGWGFSVEKCFDELCTLQSRLEKDGFIEGTEHRFVIVAG